MNPLNRLTIIADDFGLSPEINRGIVTCAREGLIHGTALLINAPATSEALKLAPQVSSIEIGLHLGLVEGYSLSGHKSLLDPVEYFQGKPCLHRDWKTFASLYLKGKISRKELADEFEAQAQEFEKKLGQIPFLNGTQHLHMLPGIFPIVRDLCQRHKISRMRISSIPFKELLFTKEKLVGGFGMNVCRLLDKKGSIKDLGQTYGISVSGAIDEKFIDFVLKENKKRPIELVVHPGFNDENLRRLLPESYTHFDWELELRSLRYLKEKKHD